MARLNSIGALCQGDTLGRNIKDYVAIIMLEEIFALFPLPKDILREITSDLPYLKIDINGQSKGAIENRTTDQTNLIQSKLIESIRFSTSIKSLWGSRISKIDFINSISLSLN